MSDSLPAREGFFCEIRHSQHIIGSFQGIAGVVGFPDGRTSLESVWRAKRIRDYREKHGLNLRQLAGLLDLTVV